MNPHLSDPAPNLLADYASLEYILLGDLRDLLEEPPDQQTRKWLLAVLDALLETLPQEFRLEEKDGYMSHVLELKPHWWDEVAHLRAEHAQLFGALKALRGEIARRENFHECADEARTALKDWMATLIAHNRHENRLVQTAVNLEIGIGD